MLLYETKSSHVGLRQSSAGIAFLSPAPTKQASQKRRKGRKNTTTTTIRGTEGRC
jgi:hypothetical protein